MTKPDSTSPERVLTGSWPRSDASSALPFCTGTTGVQKLPANMAASVTAAETEKKATGKMRCFVTCMLASVEVANELLQSSG